MSVGYWADYAESTDWSSILEEAEIRQVVVDRKPVGRSVGVGCIELGLRRDWFLEVCIS